MLKDGRMLENKYILLDSLMWNMAGYFYELKISKGSSKYSVTCKNIQPYPTSNCLISDLLSNEFRTYIKKKLRIKYKVLENCVTKRGIPAVYLYSFAVLLARYFL